MRTIENKEYAHYVEDVIEQAVEIALFDTFNGIADRFGFPKQNDFGEFSGIYYDGYAAEIRDKAIALFEDCGMDIISDGSEF